jgi:hypothetical protein
LPLPLPVERPVPEVIKLRGLFSDALIAAFGQEWTPPIF